jgi:hypothetical protein
LPPTRLNSSKVGPPSGFLPKYGKRNLRALDGPLQ